MKALVYHGPGKLDFEDKPKPIIKAPTDAIVKITTTTICGTDLHILKGDVPTGKMTDRQLAAKVSEYFTKASAGATVAPKKAKPTSVKRTKKTGK